MKSIGEPIGPAVVVHPNRWKLFAATHGRNKFIDLEVNQILRWLKIAADSLD